MGFSETQLPLLRPSRKPKKAGLISRLSVVAQRMSRLVATKRSSTPRPAVLETRFLLLGPPADGSASNARGGAWLLISLPDSLLYLAHDPISRERSESTRNRGKLKTLNRRWGVWDVNATHLVGESPILRSSQKLGFRYCRFSETPKA